MRYKIAIWGYEIALLRYEMVISRCEIAISRYKIAISRYEIVILRYEIVISRYEIVILRYEIVILGYEIAILHLFVGIEDIVDIENILIPVILAVGVKRRLGARRPSRAIPAVGHQANEYHHHKRVGWRQPDNQNI